LVMGLVPATPASLNANQREISTWLSLFWWGFIDVHSGAG
jgi:hypothetical protein